MIWKRSGQTLEGEDVYQCFDGDKLVGLVQREWHINPFIRQSMPYSMAYLCIPSPRNTAWYQEGDMRTVRVTEFLSLGEKRDDVLLVVRSLRAHGIQVCYVRGEEGKRTIHVPVSEQIGICSLTKKYPKKPYFYGMKTGEFVFPLRTDMAGTAQELCQSIGVWFGVDATTEFSPNPIMYV